MLRALWKRKVLAGLVWLTGTAAAVTAVQLMPAIFRAETLVLFESQRSPEASAKATAQAEMQALLNTQRQQILSSERLLQIIRKFGLYHAERQRHTEGEIIELMRRDIEVTLDRGWSRGRPGAFSVAYQGRDPGLVAKVANQLGGLYIEANSRPDVLQAGGAPAFLDNQVQEARRRLQEQEARLGEYKQKYSGQLPQQENALLAELGRLQVQLQGIQDAAKSTQQNKVLTETMLAAAQQSETALSEIVDQLAANSGGASIETGERESERLQGQLNALRLRYTDEHPEVRKTRELLAKVRQWEQKNTAPNPGQGTGKEGEGGAARPEAKPAMNARTGTLAESLLQERERIKTLTAQRDLAAQQLQALDGERKRVAEQMAAMEGRVAKLPVREQELTALTREYELSKVNYQSLVDKSLATEIERRQNPERFTILESARIPERPLKPNRSLFEALGTVVALFLGVSIGLGSEVRRGVVLGEWELPKDVAVLGRVPAIRKAPAAGRGQRSGSTLRRLMLAAAVVLLAAGVLGVALYFRWIPV